MTGAAKRTRILHITRNLPPLVGGMERLNWHIADELSKHAEVQVIGPQGSAAGKPEAVALAEVPLRPLWRFLLASAWRSVRTARSFKPDLVLAGSGLTAPAAWLAARVCGARAAVYLHGLDAAVKHPLYRALWHPAIRRMDVVIANSRPTAELARRLGVAEGRLRIVHPGVTLPAAPQPDARLQDYRQRHALGQARLLLSVGRLAARKGLLEFVQQALPLISRQAPDVRLVIIGDAPSDALLAHEQTREVIQQAADAAGLGDRLHFLGRVDELTLACAYESAALHIFPVRDLHGDPEGFGMVAIEAAAHGTPTVAFATGGIVDAVSEGQSGRLVPPGDYPALADATLEVLADDRQHWGFTTQKFAKSFAWPVLGEKLWTVLR